MEASTVTAVASTKHLLDLLAISHHHFSSSILTTDNLQALSNQAQTMHVLLEEALGEDFLNGGISDLLVSLDKNLQMLLRKEKHYVNLTVMDSLLWDSLGQNYFQSQVRDKQVPMKLKLKPLFCREEFDEIKTTIILLDSLLEDLMGKRLYPKSSIGDVVNSMKLKLMKEMKPVLRLEFLKLYRNINLMDSLLTYYPRSSHPPNTINEIHNRIEHVARDIQDHVQFKFHQKVPTLAEFISNPRANDRGWIQSIEHSFNKEKLLELDEVIDGVNVELKKFHQTSELEEDITTSSAGQLVGHHGQVEEMLRWLHDYHRSRVYCITGMAGIGKTTVAKALYDHSWVKEQFKFRVWVTAPREYSLREFFMDILNCIDGPSDELLHLTVEELNGKLRKFLGNNECLVVLDNVWYDWNRHLMHFLEITYNYGIRFLLTTRFQNLADTRGYRNSDIYLHILRCLSQDESWVLLQSQIFNDEPCPRELLPIGEKIAHECYGLPLGIIFIARILSKMERAPNVWHRVAQNVSSLIINYPSCREILASSYDGLSVSLKRCFHYMGVFPQGYEISRRKLKCLWIAEGFILADYHQTMDEVAENYLEDLIAIGLVLVKTKGQNGRRKTCYIHNVMREFCLRELRRDNSLHVVRCGGVAMRYADGILEKEWYKSPRFGMNSNSRIFWQIGASSPFTRSLLCLEEVGLPDCIKGFMFEELEILNMTSVNLVSIPSWVKRLTRLKYLALTVQNVVHLTELSKLRKLETCIIDGEGSGHLSEEFWHMSELRHFHLTRRSLLKTHHEPVSKSASALLENLCSLSTIGPSSCTKEIFLSVPNLKSLSIQETEEDGKFSSWFKNLEFLTKLETLKYTFSNSGSPSPSPAALWLKNNELWVNNLPQKLKKLTLSGTRLRWQDIHHLTMLRNLEELKLKNHAVSGEDWLIGSWCFLSLKLLLIDRTNLVRWDAEDYALHQLRRLVLRHCNDLKYIHFGGMPSLEEIELHCCSDSAAREFQKLHCYSDFAAWELQQKQRPRIKVTVS